MMDEHLWQEEQEDAEEALLPPYLRQVDTQKDEEFNDLHMLFGAVCALAELQQALPGELTSAVPLRLVLDRRPFI